MNILRTLAMASLVIVMSIQAHMAFWLELMLSLSPLPILTGWNRCSNNCLQKHCIYLSSPTSTKISCLLTLNMIKYHQQTIGVFHESTLTSSLGVASPECLLPKAPNRRITDKQNQNMKKHRRRITGLLHRVNPVHKLLVHRVVEGKDVAVPLQERPLRGQNHAKPLFFFRSAVIGAWETQRRGRTKGGEGPMRISIFISSD